MTGGGVRTVVVTDPVSDLDDPRTAGVLRSAGLEIRHAPRIGERTAEEVIAFTADAPEGVVSTDPFVAGISVAAQREGLETAVAAAVAVLGGGRPAGLVNPGALASPALDWPSRRWGSGGLPEAAPPLGSPSPSLAERQ